MPKSPNIVDGLSATERLVRFMASHPNPHLEYSLADIAREIYATRAFVQHRLPTYAAERASLQEKEALRRVRALARTHAKSRESRRVWSISNNQVARLAGVAPRVARKLSAEIGVEQRPKMDEAERVIRVRRRSAIWAARVLRVETCTYCGRMFSWRNLDQRAARSRRRRVVCSHACANRQIAAEKRAARGEA